MSDLPVEGPQDEGTAEPFATALSHKAGAGAQVLAQGQGAMASRIAAVAQDHNVPVLQDFALSQALQKVPVGSQIPEPLFKALAGVLDYLFRAEADAARQHEEDQNNQE